jgi:hypothetical protein
MLRYKLLRQLKPQLQQFKQASKHYVKLYSVPVTCFVCGVFVMTMPVITLMNISDEMARKHYKQSKFKNKKAMHFYNKNYKIS